MIFFFDLDGTLIEGPKGVHQPTDKSVEAIQILKQKGHQVFVCTGRSLSIVPSRVYEIDLDGLIVSNGAEIYYKNELLKRFELPHAFVDNIVKRSKVDKFDYMLEYNSGISVARKSVSVITFCKEYGLPMEIINESLFNVKPVKCCIVYEDTHDYPEELNQLHEDFRLIRVDDRSFDFMNDAITKGSAIEYLIQHIGKTSEDCIAFGDGENDKEMMSFVGIGVAMKKASDSLKAIASHTTDDVEEEGVYNFLKLHGYLD